MAREANLFETGLSYPSVAHALSVPESKGFLGTIEFFPEEGKYHFDGHRNCKVCQKPAVTRETGGVCPVCGRKITLGVLHRVEELADREDGHVPKNARHFESLVPLKEVVSSAMGLSPASKKVDAQYEALLCALGPELVILRESPLEDIGRAGGPCLSEAVRRLRRREVSPFPGSDGAFGRVEILSKSDLDSFSGQVSFPGLEAAAQKSANPAKKPASPPSRPQTDTGRAALSPSEGLPYGLNKQQWLAASAPDPVVAVLAGPGTGKTKTLVSRIACLVERRRVPPGGITAVTFTNKAAGEMRERLQIHFGNKRAVGQMTIGTFHSICLKLLTGLGEQTAVLDEFGAQAILADILQNLGVKQSPREALREISKIKNGGAGSVPEEVLAAYNAQLLADGLVDFDDILLRVLERYESTNRETLLRPSHLLVDEFQDVGDLQYRLIRAWASEGSLFVIGDPDQSIYGFRGSSVRCFERLSADRPDIRTIGLQKNYRSTPQIIGCALSVLARGKEHLSACHENGAPVRIVKAGDDFSQALFITKEIGRMVGGIDLLAAHAQPGGAAENPRGFSDIAILYRTHRQAELIGECLGIDGIPYVVAGRDEFLLDASVRTASGFFAFLLNPANQSLLRSCLQAFKIEPTVRKHILDAYFSAGQDPATLLPLLFDSFPSAESRKLAGLMERFSPLIKKGKPGRLLEIWIEQNALSGNPNIERLYGAALMNPDMPTLLHNLSLGRESDVVRSGNKKRPPDAVLLCTLHGAKGLEFPVVFLAGATDGLIPLKTGAALADTAEEMRLFYVGVTRAQESLTVLHTSEPSPFLSGFPPNLSSRKRF